MLRDALGWDAWKPLTDGDKLTVAREVITSLGSAGEALGEPWLESFGPPDATQRIAIVQDVDRDVAFAFVPGGRLAPGLGEAEMARFWDLQKAELEMIGARASEHQVPYKARAWSPAQLERRPAVDVGPMLIAIDPLTSTELKLPKPRFSSRPLLTWEAANDASARLGYAIPTSDQLEWATTAGIPTLFYWGDALPAPMDPRDADAADLDRDDWEDGSEEFARIYMDLPSAVVAPWPTSNRFGLQGTAGQPVWCRGEKDEPLVAGGAARCFPWQGCGEWLWLLSALRVDARTIERHQGAMLRPVISVSVSVGPPYR
jgi:hypothetical protein